jgi:hypothetical protein
MSDGWVYRKADQHECNTPDIPPRGDVHPGDVWRCGKCGQVWVVKDSQMDGLYIVKASERDLDHLAMRGIDLR